MLDSALRAVNDHGKESTSDLLEIFETFLKEVSWTRCAMTHVWTKGKEVKKICLQVLTITFNVGSVNFSIHSCDFFLHSIN